MKKVIFALVAAGMTMTSCMNEEFPNATSYGQLYVNVSNDLQMNTRAAVSDLSTWVVSAVGPKTYTLTSTSTNVKAGTYTVNAKSHADEAAALAENKNWGAAYYEGSTSDIKVEAGKTAPATVDCGKAKNARLKVEFNLLENFTDYSLTVQRDENTDLVFNKTNALAGMENPALAYFAASKLNEDGEIIEGQKTTVAYTLNYTYNGVVKEPKKSNIVLGGPATENIITVSSNDNGTITVKVNYDETFDTGEKQEYTFDAATGEEVK